MLKAIGIFLIIFGASKAQEGQSRYPEYDEQMCQGLDESAIIGIPNECYFYYYCYEGVAYLDDCENVCEGCQFDVNIMDCNYQEKAKCVSSSPPRSRPPASVPLNRLSPPIIVDLPGSGSLRPPSRVIPNQSPQTNYGPFETMLCTQFCPRCN